jgi:hypothetical protein
LNRKNIINHLITAGAIIILSLVPVTAVVSDHPEMNFSALYRKQTNTEAYRIITPAGVASSLMTRGAIPPRDPRDDRTVESNVLQRTLPFQSTLFYAGTDWSNFGGDAQRNGMSETKGPIAETLLWSGGNTSLISWLPVTEGNRLFLVRQKSWPGSPNDSPIFAMDLLTGERLWVSEIPYHTGDWITWVAGVKNGQVYASRSGNGATVKDNLYALDAETGDTLWVSDDLIDAGPYDGVVFAADGDPIIASFTDIWRINAADGATVWHANRLGSVTDSCGGALYQDAFYVADVTAGGHIIVRYDVNSGQRLYQSPVMPGFTLQNTPMVGPDGSIYLSRTQNNTFVDFFYAFSDTGTNLIEKWHIPCAWTVYSEFTVGPDGGVYCITPGPRITKLNPNDGSLLAQTPIIGNPEPSLSPHFATDADGTVYYSNGGFSSGQMFVFTSTLDPLWNTTMKNINIGGPSLGKNGVLVICGTGTNMRAYQRPIPLVEVNATGGLLKIHATITNIGTIDATNLSWSITVQGGLFKRINRTSTGIITMLSSHEAVNVTTAGFIIGFGKIDIAIQADQVIKSLKGFVLGPFIFILS